MEAKTDTFYPLNEKAASALTCPAPGELDVSKKVSFRIIVVERK
jgi:hypothetical protein